MHSTHKRSPFSHIATAVISLYAASAAAGPTTLALRSENTWCAPLAIETGFGTNTVAAPFAGTTTYDFFSPSLLQPMTLTTADKGAGFIFMSNTSRSTSNDFTVSGEMQYYDYDPATGANTLIVDTGVSISQQVKHGNSVNWSTPKVSLPANHTIPAGHELHLALTIVLVSGNPGSFGQLLYNGPNGSSSAILLPQNNVVSWMFGTASQAAAAVSISTPASSVCAYSTGNTASISNTAACLWTISNGTLTAGQGTSQITWTAGPLGPVSLSVTIGQSCTASGTATVNVVGEPGTLSVSALADATVQLVCSGTPGQTYRLQAATNLAAPVWTTLTTSTPGSTGIFQFIDQDATNYPCRFYRTATP